jgi:guanosine-3',5'-bis(diphosphate) 3'-pyrophosphohydrolase
VTDSTPTGSISALRSGFSRLFSKSGVYATEVADLVRVVKINHPKADLSVIERAFAAAEAAHDGQMRKSGEPYITHPLAVAKILADLGIGPITVAAALLHDTVEDTAYSLDMVTKDFGDEIAMLVDGVTKLDKVKYGDHAQAETVRKMVVAMSKDIRVLVIKLCDRLHNARTWEFVPPEKARKKAQETLEIYAPLAHRLGINTVKWELEDLSFSILYPKVYEEIVNLVRQRTPKRAEFIDNVIAAIEQDLRDAKVKGKVDGRPKQYYSIYQKMVVRGREFDDIYDLVGIRVLVPTVRDCYAILGAIHARWNPVPGRFKDYIAMPKFNLYQSLHTTVIGPNGRPVEIQIRTVEMHQRAEFGVAAHWKYKEQAGQSAVTNTEEDLAWLKHLTDWQAETQDPGEFLDSLRFEIGAKEVYVFTPKGKVIGLPSGATPVDFAYAVHTEVGHRTMGAKVNGRLVPLESQLNSGDVVEIFTSKSAEGGPSKDWVNFVASPRAKAKIKAWFSAERRDEAIEHGKDQIAKYMRKQNLPLQRLMSADSVSKLASDLKYPDVSALYAAVGEGHISAQSVVERLTVGLVDDDDADDHFQLPTRPSSANRSRSDTSGVMVRGDDSVMSKLARCCTPVPGDEIIGFVTRGNGVSVHRADCRNVEDLKLEPERIMDVSWSGGANALFLVQIQIEALDRSGLLSDVTRVLAEHKVNILSASVSTRADRVALSRFVFEMGDAALLDRLLSAVRRIEAVYDVYRVANN